MVAPLVGLLAPIAGTAARVAGQAFTRRGAMARATAEMLTEEEAVLHDSVKQAEQTGDWDKMQKDLDKFSRLNPKAYMTLLD